MTGKKSKMVSVALIVLMLGAIFGALPGIISGASEIQDGTIVVVIKDSSGPVPAGYEINVYSADDNSMNSYTLDTRGYIEVNVPAGHYIVKAPVQTVGNKAYFGNSTDTLTVEPGKTVDSSLVVDSKSLDYKVTGTVSDSAGNPVEGAGVSIIDYSTGYVTSTTTDVNGSYSLQIYSGTFGIWSSKVDVGTYYSTGQTINTDTTINIQLDDKPYLTGYVTDASTGKGIQSTVHVTVYDKDNGNVVVKDNDRDGPFFQVSIYSGHFSVLISSDGYNAYFKDDVNSTGNTVDLGDISLTPAVKTQDNVAYSFGSDFNDLSAVRTISLSPADVIQGLNLSESGNVRYQIDSQFGNSDGSVNAYEAANFTDWIKSMYPPVVSDSLLVNDTYFNETGTSITVSNATGSVTSDKPIEITVSSTYSPVKNIWDKDVPVKVLAKYDSDMHNYSYSLTVPEGFERAELEAPSDVSVSGYTTINIDPQSGSGIATVTFNLEKSVKGNASVSVATGEYVYQRTDVNNNDTYIVKTGKNVSFSAIFNDPNGNEEGATYSWDFGDGSSGSGANVEHAFNSGGKYTVTLTVTEVNGYKDTAEVYIQSDNTAPTPDAKLNMTEVNERQSVEFDASSSTDTIDGHTAGIVLSYQWDFGDGNKSVQKIADHAYEKWGRYTVTLNVTDAVGNYRSVTKQITVLDKTPPVPKFNWTDANNHTHSSDDVGTATVTKGNTITFDASPSYDPPGFDGTSHSISYSWNFEDTNTTADTKIVSHTFDKAGTYAVKLKVTDSKGNYKEITKLFEVKYGPVPRLEVKNLTLSNSEPRAGESVWIIANVSNFGDAAALNPTVIFYVNDKALSGTPQFYVYQDGKLVDSNSTIPAGEYRIVKMQWTPQKGTVKLKVNATDPAEPSFAPITHEKEIKVTVGQPKWMDYIPIALAVIAIVGVIAIYVMYSKGMGPFSTEAKSKNKEKKEKK